MAELTVRVLTPEAIPYEGPARALATKNRQGDLSILPWHVNFISIIEEKLVITKPDGSKQEIPVDQGILYCLEDKVEVYIGIKAATESLAS